MKKTLFLLVFLSVPLLTSASINTNLSYGSRGQQVIELQNYLINKGFFTGTPSGNFFSLTKSAVLKYQASVALPTTGTIGPLTRTKINTDLATITPTSNQVKVNETSSVTALTSKVIDLTNQMKALQNQVTSQTIQNSTPPPVQITVVSAPQTGTPNNSTPSAPVASPVTAPKATINPHARTDFSFVGGRVTFTPTFSNTENYVTLRVTTTNPDGFQRFGGAGGGQSLMTQDQTFLISSDGMSGSIVSQLKTAGTYDYTFTLPDYGGVTVTVPVTVTTLQ